MIIDRLLRIDLSDSQKLAPYWQRTPVFLEKSVDAGSLVPYTETLISILTETDLPSRLITGMEGSRFTLKPTTFKQFRMPKGPWSVLIQAIEQLFPEYDLLRQQLNWIPNWRFEDCMLSWASKGGSVGRHFDHFSVFLIQLNGHRHWEVGPQATTATQMLSGQELALVSPDTPVATFIAEPGDVLYLPPHIIHHGVAIDSDCMTLSIGFRAPNVTELLESALELSATEGDMIRYNDRGLKPRNQTAKIELEDLSHVREAILEIIADNQFLSDILGSRVTSPYLDLQFEDPLSDDTVELLIKTVKEWELDPSCRVAYFEKILYCNGERVHDLTPPEIICFVNLRRIETNLFATLDSFWQNWLRELIRTELLAPVEHADP